MKVLFVRQNFPGQYKHLVAWLAAQGGHQIVALSQREQQEIQGITHVRYAPHCKAAQDAYGLVRHWEDSMGMGFSVVQACQQLQSDEFRPDLVIGHVGWGELTFLKQVWPETPILGYFEYFYLAQGCSVGFDPEFPASEHTPFLMHARNAVNFANIQTVDLDQSPTQSQCDTFPVSFRQKIYVCHDGIRTDIARPNSNASVKLRRVDRPLTRADEIFTFMARNLEPRRGFHQFTRALPRIQKAPMLEHW